VSDRLFGSWSGSPGLQTRNYYFNEGELCLVSNGEATTGNVTLISSIRNSDWMWCKKGRHFLLEYKKISERVSMLKYTE
jgi:hypothetical protein